MVAHKAEADALAEVICFVPNSRYCEKVPLCSNISAVKSPEITVLETIPRKELYKPISTFGTSLGSLSTRSSVRISTGFGSSTSSQENDTEISRMTERVCTSMRFISVLHLYLLKLCAPAAV